MKKTWIAFVFNKADNKDYGKRLREHLEKEGIAPKSSNYQSNLEIEYDSWILRPGVVFSTWPELKSTLTPYAHHFVFFYYKPAVRNIAAKTHMELLWSKNTIVMSIPIIDNQKWMEEATLHEWVHACHLIKMRHFIPTKDTMDRYSGILDGLEESMIQIRPYWDTILKKPETISLLERLVDTMKKLLQSLQQLIAIKEKPPIPSPDPTPDGKWYCLHHSATSRDWTRAETIIDNHKEIYGGKCFYAILIDKDGTLYTPIATVKERGTTDICVLGDFTKEEPTQKQVDALKSIITGQKWTTHKDLAKQGLATPSLCPGNLTNFI